MIRNKKIVFFVYFSELLSTQALIVPVKTLFFLHFLMNTEDISLFRFIFVLFIFVFELPFGYLADRLGNKCIFLLSKVFTILSLCVYIIFPSFIGFIVANVSLGIAGALDSGAGTSFFLYTAEAYDFDYRAIRVKTNKYVYYVNFGLMLLSSLLFDINVILPFLITALLFILSALMVYLIPSNYNETSQSIENNGIKKNSIEKNSCIEKNNDAEKDNNVDEENIQSTPDLTFLKMMQLVFRKALNDRQLLLQMMFYVVCTTILISNFDYYAVFFNNVNIDIVFFGSIFSSFMLINALGVQIYEIKKTKIFKNLLLFLLPFSFVLLTTQFMALIFLGVVIQQLCFSYYSVNFDIFVMDSITDLTSSSSYQAAIDFVIALIRLGLTLVITFFIMVLDLKLVYYGFLAITLLVTMLYFMFKDKDSKRSNNSL